MDGSPCANAITASGCSTRADSVGAAPPNSRIRLRTVARHSWGQCSSVSGAPWQCGQVVEESASKMFRYAASLWQWSLHSWDSRTESFLEREIGARLPLKTALVLSWLLAGYISSLFVKTNVSTVLVSRVLWSHDLSLPPFSRIFTVHVGSLSQFQGGAFFGVNLSLGNWSRPMLEIMC